MAGRYFGRVVGSSGSSIDLGSDSSSSVSCLGIVLLDMLESSVSLFGETGLRAVSEENW